MQHPGTGLANSIVLIKVMHKTEIFVYHKEDIEIKRKMYINKRCLYKT